MCLAIVYFIRRKIENNEKIKINLLALVALLVLVALIGKFFLL